MCQGWRTRRSCPICTNKRLRLYLWVFTSNQLRLAIVKKKRSRVVGTLNRRPFFEIWRRRTTVLKSTSPVRPHSADESAAIRNEPWRTQLLNPDEHFCPHPASEPWRTYPSGPSFWTTATGNPTYDFNSDASLISRAERVRLLFWWWCMFMYFNYFYSQLFMFPVNCMKVVARLSI